MTRLEDVAREAGVSIGTVQQPLYNKGRIAQATRERVLETAKRLGCQPNTAAQGLAARKKAIRLGFFYVDDPFSPCRAPSPMRRGSTPSLWRSTASPRSSSPCGNHAGGVLAPGKPPADPGGALL